MHDTLARTPNYLMMHDHVVFGPKLTTASAEEGAHVVFAFTDKLQYDAFWATMNEKMTPYPLVKSYLRNRLQEDNSVQWLMVLDARNDHETRYQASTFQEVLISMEKRLDSVPITHCLTLDSESIGYAIAVVDEVP